MSCGKLVNESLDPYKIRFYPNVNTLAKINSWELLVSKDDKELKKYSGQGNPPELIDWNILKDSSMIFSSNSPLNYSFKLIEDDAKNYTAEPGNVPVLTI